MEVGSLLYGAWTAERILAPQALLTERPETLHPVTRAIMQSGLAVTGVEIFRAQHRLQALAKAISPIWRDIDFLLVPTTGTAYTLTQIAADPIARNSDLGFYTNFTNLLDLAAIAVPSGFTARGFPTGVTLIGPAWGDMALAGVARRMQQLAATPLGATGFPQTPVEPPRQASPTAFPAVDLAVFGSHLSGEPLNCDLLALGASFRRGCKTAPIYRMNVLPGLPAARLDPGRSRRRGHRGRGLGHPLRRDRRLPEYDCPPLGIGTVLLEGGLPCLGFICEGEAASAGAKDISSYGSWRAYREAVRRQFGCPSGDDVPAPI